MRFMLLLIASSHRIACLVWTRGLRRSTWLRQNAALSFAPLLLCSFTSPAPAQQRPTPVTLSAIELPDAPRPLFDSETPSDPGAALKPSARVSHTVSYATRATLPRPHPTL